MSNQYTISAVSEKTRDYGEGQKANRVYYVKLQEAQAEVPSGAFELHQRQTSKPPTEGLKIDVKTFQNGEFNGTPFVKIIKDFGNYNADSGSTGGGDKNFERRPEHPRNEARMIHTGALGSAPEYYRLFREENFIDKPQSLDAAKETLLGLVGWLEGSYRLDAVAGAQAPQNGAERPQSEVPAGTSDLPF